MNDLLHAFPLIDALVYALFWTFFAAASAVATPAYMILYHLPKSALNALYRTALASEPEHERVVVVTGCDSGFGLSLALKLAGAPGRWTVFAYCLTKEGCARLASLSGSKNAVRPLLVDVTDQGMVDAAADSVRLYLSSPHAPSSPPRAFHGLVSNAGVGSPGTVDMLPLDRLDGHPFSLSRDMDVNYYGSLRVIKSLMSLYKAQSKSGGPPTSLVSVTSMAGLLPSPFMPAYAASKHAMEAASTCMRHELRPLGVRVCTVNPSFHETPLVSGIGDGVDRLWMATEGYGRGYMSQVKMRGVQGSKIAEWRAENVTRVVYRALRWGETGQRMVGSDAKYALAPMRHLPREVQDFVISGWPGAAFWIKGRIED